MNLSFEWLEALTVGEVYDMLIEQANDFEEYPVKATQSDINAFFGGAKHGE